MTEPALNNLSLVGSMLIFCVGVNLVWEKKFKVANMLPAIVVAVIWLLYGSKVSAGHLFYYQDFAGVLAKIH